MGATDMVGDAVSDIDATEASPNPDADEAPAYRFDVFVSYADADSAWVEDWLVPALEKAKLRVATISDDARLGGTILDETERLVCESRRTLAVMTPEWVASGWNAYHQQITAWGDPAAWQRRLIPMLLRACTPPKRIAFLTFVDFSDAKTREMQLRRVIDDINDKVLLEEIRRDLIIPGGDHSKFVDIVRKLVPMQMALLAVAFLGLGFLVVPRIVGWWNDRKMPLHTLNIAVADLAPTDLRSGDSLPPTVDGVADSIKRHLEDPDVEAAIAAALPPESPFARNGLTVHRIGAVNERNVMSKADDINAHVVVFGTVSKRSSVLWSLQPKFYFSNQLGRTEGAPDLNGQSDLGYPIDIPTVAMGALPPPDREIARRLNSLMTFIRGLENLRHGTELSVVNAVASFDVLTTGCEADASDTWTTFRKNGPPGEAMFFSFLGSALTFSSYFAASATSDAVDESAAAATDTLARAECAFHSALAQDDEVVRARAGLGNVYRSMASPTGEEEECDYDWETLEEAIEEYQHVVDQFKPSIETRAERSTSKYVAPWIMSVSATAIAGSQTAIAEILLERWDCRDSTDDRQRSEAILEALIADVGSQAVPATRKKLLSPSIAVAHRTLARLAYSEGVDRFCPPEEDGWEVACRQRQPDSMAQSALTSAVEHVGRVVELSCADMFGLVEVDLARDEILYNAPILLISHCLLGQPQEAALALGEIVWMLHPEADASVEELCQLEGAMASESAAGIPVNRRSNRQATSTSIPAQSMDTEQQSTWNEIVEQMGSGNFVAGTGAQCIAQEGS